MQEQLQNLFAAGTNQFLSSNSGGADVQKILKDTNLASLFTAGKLPTSAAGVSSLLNSAGSAFLSSPSGFMRTVVLFVGSALPWYLLLPASLALGAVFYISWKAVWKVFHFVLFGAGRNAIVWWLTAGQRSERAAQMRKERDDETAKFVAWAASDADGCPSPTEQQRREIAELPIAALRARMTDRLFSPVFLLKLYVLNAAAAHKVTNAVCGWRVDSAIADAKRAEDVYFRSASVAARDRRLRAQPLLGVPISIKECLPVAGCYSTAGCVYFAEQNGRVEHTSAAPMALMAKGAVVFVTTNVPQTMLAYDCNNNIYGPTGNAHNPAHSPGGSSGGEGALIAGRGSPGGIGTDVGGSVRIPASFNGLFGLRPSIWRAPSSGGTSPVAGQEGVSSTAGPSARSIEDVVELFRALVSQPEEEEEDLGEGEGKEEVSNQVGSAIDGTMMDVPWRQDMFDRFKNKKSLRVGVCYEDGWLALSPACRRAVKETADALKAAGHTVIEFEPPRTKNGNENLIVKVMELFYQFMSADGCDTVSKKFDGFEPPMKAVVITYLLGRVMPEWFFNTVVPFFLQGSSSLMANGLRNIKKRDVADYYATLAKRNDARTEYARACWGGEQRFDCVISPVFPLPPPKIGATDDKSWGVSYTATFNVLDCSAVVVPVTQVDPAKDAWKTEEGSKAKPQFDMMDRKLRAIYDENEMSGLPVGVQILGPRFSEERVLGCAKVVSDVMNARTPMPPFLAKKK